jgi:hypothetical protein
MEEISLYFAFFLNTKCDKKKAIRMLSYVLFFTVEKGLLACPRRILWMLPPT